MVSGFYADLDDVLAFFDWIRTLLANYKQCFQFGYLWLLERITQGQPRPGQLFRCALGQAVDQVTTFRHGNAIAQCDQGASGH